jgi:uncharacterized protein (TIGR03067 family)
MKGFIHLLMLATFSVGIVAIASWGVLSAGEVGSEETELEGKWVGIPQTGSWACEFSGTQFSITSPNPNMWYKGTFTIKTNKDPKQIDLLLKEMPLAQYVGKTSLGIYKIEGNNLTLALNEPGKPDRPESFTASGGTQVFIFTKK